MIVHPGHPIVSGYSQAGNPTPSAEKDWTWVCSPAPLWGTIEALCLLDSIATHKGSGLRHDRKRRGHSASSAWVVNFNNGNCNLTGQFFAKAYLGHFKY